MTATLENLMNEREKYRAIWHRTYAPLRRVIAGIWMKLPDGKGLEVRFTADGGFELNDFERGVFLNGRYTIVPFEGGYGLAVESAGETWALKIEEVDPWRLKLRWLDDVGASIELTRRQESARAS